MNTCVLSEKAKDDLLEICLYTLETWGEEQLPTYQNLMEAAMQRIQFPST